METSTAHQILAHALVKICPADFQTARIVARVKDDWSNVEYECDTPTGTETGLGAPAELDFAVDDALHDLRNMMKQDGRPGWSSCIFTVSRDGNFKFDVNYD